MSSTKKKKECLKHQNQVKIYNQEMKEKLERFRRARAKWKRTQTGMINITQDFADDKRFEADLESEAEYYKGRFFFLRKIGFKTNRLRTHYKTLRPLRYYTLDRRIPGDDEEIDEEDDPFLGRRKKKKTFEDLLKSDATLMQIRKKKRKKRTEDEAEGAAKIDWTTQILNKFRQARRKSKVLKPCVCDHGKEVTFIIKGVCLCDQKQIKQFSKDATCKDYCKTKLDQVNQDVTAKDSLEQVRKSFDEKKAQAELEAEKKEEEEKQDDKPTKKVTFDSRLQDLCVGIKEFEELKKCEERKKRLMLHYEKSGEADEDFEVPEKFKALSEYEESPEDQQMAETYEGEKQDDTEKKNFQKKKSDIDQSVDKDKDEKHHVTYGKEEKYEEEKPVEEGPVKGYRSSEVKLVKEDKSVEEKSEKKVHSSEEKLVKGYKSSEGKLLKGYKSSEGNILKGYKSSEGKLLKGYKSSEGNILKGYKFSEGKPEREEETEREEKQRKKFSKADGTDLTEKESSLLVIYKNKNSRNASDMALTEEQIKVLEEAKNAANEEEQQQQQQVKK